MRLLQPAVDSMPDPLSSGKSRFADLRAHMRVLRYWPYVLLLAGCAIVLTLLATSRDHSRLGLEAIHTVQENRSRLDRLDALLLTVVDAESGVRGYILTHNDDYLEPYRDSETRVGHLLVAMEDDFPADSVDRDEFEVLKKLVALKRRHLAQAVASGDIEDTGSPEQAGPGKAFMDQIRLSIAALHERRAASNAQLTRDSLLRLEHMQTAVTALAVGALGLLIMLFGVQQQRTRLRTRIATLLADENNMLESTVSQRTRELSDLASYLTNTREAERGRLARELHDELGALLTAARMDAAWLLRSLGPSAGQDIRERFKRLIDTIGSGITLKRRLIDDLRPPLLQGLGLVEALRALADDFSREVPVELLLPDTDPDPTEDQALAVFRIAQEAFTNIRKYAHAAHVELGLDVADGELQLWIRDDGVGFDADSPMLNRHGLAGMQHRVQMFGGQLTVTAAPGKGCTIEASMPLQPRTA
ncbi:CHASE3 domain-containing protein [Zoogloea sp. LCSB751]|uniref:CHASE3 domain-containing protein n=1 Tax=Zoogloea sp. LCSB751 TaxID=1965277 RepID=UPI0013747140|nr:CHASE3 domain-containing protein [Zoogloea sp. LCSB751]